MSDGVVKRTALERLQAALGDLPEERSAQIKVTIETEGEVAAEWHDGDAWTYVSIREDDTMFLVRQRGHELEEKVVPFDERLLPALFDWSAEQEAPA
ncbi:hypothetical protein AB0O16_14535 [Microbacterium sp. NPDC089180]|uniref:hypothetical protein n=1 Tax=unclassified Microbacterium TaxID=2609290 RepID=UPI00342B006E